MSQNRDKYNHAYIHARYKYNRYRNTSHSQQWRCNDNYSNQFLYSLRGKSNAQRHIISDHISLRRRCGSDRHMIELQTSFPLARSSYVIISSAWRHRREILRIYMRITQFHCNFTAKYNFALANCNVNLHVHYDAFCGNGRLQMLLLCQIWE